MAEAVGWSEALEGLVGRLTSFYGAHGWQRALRYLRGLLAPLAQERLAIGRGRWRRLAGGDAGFPGLHPLGRRRRAR